MKKKMVTALLVAVMGLTLLTGCKKDNSQNDISDYDIDSIDINGGNTDDDTQSTEVATSEPTEAEEDLNLEIPEITTTEELQALDAVFMVGDTCYEYYNYVDDAAANYANEVNYLAEQLAGTATVYDIIVPTSLGITFPDNLTATNCSDVKDSMNTIIGKLSSDVVAVNPYNTLMQHRLDYIFFRTDHHWTSLGAYYAYTDFCEAAGLTAHDLADYTEVREYDGFLGSFYTDAGQPENLRNNPDTVYAYVPVTYASCTMKVTDSDGSTFGWPILCDVSAVNAGGKYGTFIAGDNPYTVITNESITDGSSCVVVKESFGNALVPYLIDHYQTVYVIDYRYWNGKLITFVTENNIDTVILCNNISMIRNKYLVGQLGNVIY